jgi:membrane protein DedA with SNARE-associated domain
MAFVGQYGYWVIFAIVLVDQAGLPVPSTPILVVAGGFIAEGEMQLPTTVAVVTLAALPGDWVWYEFGRARGPGVLRLLCRISLEPDSCVQRTRNAFARTGPLSLLVAKFLPGLDTAAPPLAGSAHMRRWAFLVFSVAGTLIWAGSLLGLGTLLGAELYQIAQSLAAYGALAVGGLLTALLVYLGLKLAQRQRVLHSLRVARIGAEELFERQEQGEPLTIVDLRSSFDLEFDPERVRGAIQIPFEEIEARHEEIPRDREVVVYCS